MWKWSARGGGIATRMVLTRLTALVIDGSTYRLMRPGMRTGWVFEDGQWFYHSSSGAQAVGVRSGVYWYYLDPARRCDGDSGLGAGGVHLVLPESF